MCELRQYPFRKSWVVACHLERRVIFLRALQEEVTHEALREAKSKCTLEKAPEEWKETLAMTTNIYKLVKRFGLDIHESYRLGPTIGLCMVDAVTIHFAVKALNFSCTTVTCRKTLAGHLDILRAEVLDSKSKIAMWLFVFVRDLWLVTATRDVHLAKKSVKTFLDEAAPHVAAIDLNAIFDGDDVSEKARAAIASDAAEAMRTLGQRWTSVRSDAKALLDFSNDALPKLVNGLAASQCVQNFTDATQALQAELSSAPANNFAKTLGSLTGLQTCFKDIDESARPKLAQRCIFLMKQTEVMTCDPRVESMLDKISKGQ
jgi:hypothetical protein